MLKSKIHRVIVTEANMDYEGSITIDREIMTAADILEHEKVQVLSISSGRRLETYAIGGQSGSGCICINGAAAKLIGEGEQIIILTYAQVPEKVAAEYSSKVVLVDSVNRITDVNRKGQAFDFC